MSLRKLPEAKVIQRPKNWHFDAPSDVLARWAERPLAADEDSDNSISMFDVIGEDFWTGGGVTAKRISAALRAIGKKDVTVKINSPGGDMFEGIAIYNLLREHPAKVTVQVMGWAASAASIIAMAGDEIRMGLGTFMMVHNAWGLVIGNRHDMREAADLFDGFDAAIADIYEARTALKRSEIEKLMDAETFMGPSEAVAKGFADIVDDGLEAKDAAAASHQSIHAKRRLDALLAQTGVPRSERRRMLREATGGMHDAAPTVKHDADLDVAAVQRLIATIRS
ncbi:head maturation protease, ClpP-related [Filomicrobium sp.]|uniref:head maturation protease, ClpP-related n=1 Tax=Filomicrobium sp. TaxID=2024831 RepID=UPI002585DFD5|nr:head maturation protease, ClpP-related [Filomicrobium sp.]MCV0371083.1 Clp protease ClpP [Filomicrobium sp.]